MLISFATVPWHVWQYSAVCCIMYVIKALNERYDGAVDRYLTVVAGRMSWSRLLPRCRHFNSAASSSSRCSSETEEVRPSRDR